MTFKTLTIGIPTYNGSKDISTALDSILSQVEPFKDRVNILISDNASTDNTLEIIDSYVRRYPNLITITANKTNLGFDGNVHNVVTKALSDFVWILSDDDALKSGALEKVISVIDDVPKLSAIFVNYDECDENLHLNSIRVRDEIQESSLCMDGNDFFFKTKTLYGLVSSLIFNRELWLTHHVERYIGTDWVFIGGLIELLSERDYCSYVIADKLLLFRIQLSSRWYIGAVPYFIGSRLMNVYSNLDRLGFKSSTHRYLVNSYYKGLFHTLLILCRDGLTFRDRFLVIFDLFKTYGFRLRTIFVYIPMLLIPSLIYKFLYRIYVRFGIGK